MKVLQLGKFYPIRGGVEKVMWDVTRGLSSHGIQCDMLCARFSGENSTEVIKFGETGRVIVLPTLFQASGTMISPKMISWLRRNASAYDIIHIHHPDPMACLALRLSGYKGRVILHWHSDILKSKFILGCYKPLQSWLIGRAERIVGTTPVYVSQSTALQDVQDKVTYVPIGIDPVVPDAAGTEALQAKYPGKKIIFSLGRLVPYKGFSYLVSAAQYLPDDYIILIGGSGPLKESLEKQITDLGLWSKVELLDRVPDEMIAPLYGAAKLFVLSSVMKTEAFGIVQIEAMSTGTPVIATKIPESGVSWVNEDGVSGINVNPSDSEAIARAILSICEDPVKYNQFSENASARFEKYFRFERMINKIISIYENKE